MLSDLRRAIRQRLPDDAKARIRVFGVAAADFLTYLGIGFLAVAPVLAALVPHGGR